VREEELSTGTDWAIVRVAAIVGAILSAVVTVVELV